jgi:glycine/D-amino acid oxidase-like deaminating enzyme
LDKNAVSSFWLDSIAQHRVKRESLEQDIEVDVAIVGGGYSGLWTAYYLKLFQPDLRIAIIESDHVGFGASGRNGGWCSGFLPMTLSELDRAHGRDAAINMYRESFRTLDEIESVLAKEEIDCDYHRGGTIRGATNVVQQIRVVDEVAELRSYGFSESDLQLLTTDDCKSRINLQGLLASSYTPHCAVIHPAILAFGLAQAVENRGVKIYENSRVTKITSRRVELQDITVRCQIVVRATEGFTSQLKQHRRTLAPLYSYMVVTEPLSDSQRAEIGWHNRETYHDARNMIIYVQITKDGRIAFGGRGAPYHFGSSVKPAFDTHNVIHQRIVESMHQVFPITKSLEITRRWGGPLGVPRNWQASVNFDRATGLASLGGYVGDGVAATNLAARTLAHLVVSDSHPLTKLPWVNNSSRKWELEPMRYLGINGLLKLSTGIDKHEGATNTPDKVRTKILDMFL